MLTSVDIAQRAKLRDIREVAAGLALTEDDLELYGRYKAKVHLDVLDRPSAREAGKLVLMTGITPTPAGEGKTTTSIGLSDALTRLGRSACIALREPSLGPCFGIKGGAAGGGYAQLQPMVDINLHFTGDFHAITTAHNLLAAMVNNHIHHGNELNIDPRAVIWRRVIDMNDRSLRDIVIGLGIGGVNGIVAQTGFDITAASEVMALLCLSDGLEDLQKRLSSIIVGETFGGKPVTAGDLQASGAMTVALRDAIMPNLVQTLEGTPAFVHGGPFGNIAHGCNSIIATRMALKLADYVVTEAGFGSDLGAEKFCDIKCRTAGLKPDATVIVATVRALKMHGGIPLASLDADEPAAVERGLVNLAKHVENMRGFGLEPIVAINRFGGDSDSEVDELARGCAGLGVRFAVSDAFTCGGEGALELAQDVMQACDSASSFGPSYPLDIPIREKVQIVAKKLYGADGVDFLPAAARQIREIERLGFGALPICIAKTQYSLSDDPKRLGRPSGFRVTVRGAKLSAGAGMVVIYSGEIMTMPGLPKEPAATKIGMKPDGEIVGLF